MAVTPLHSLGQFECKEQGWKGFGSLTFSTDEGGRLKLYRPNVEIEPAQLMEIASAACRRNRRE